MTWLAVSAPYQANHGSLPDWGYVLGGRASWTSALRAQYPVWPRGYEKIMDTNERQKC
ncbi:hypothetical protein GCM10027446_14630 [Angustibacter peucedani]